MNKFHIVIFLIYASAFNQNTAACTIIYSKDGKNVFAGNNEDFLNDRNSEIWFTAATEDEYGCAFWGFKYSFFNARWIPQGGVNEKGLFMDRTAVMEFDMMRDKSKKNAGPFFLNKILLKCATVAEVIELVNKYNLNFFTKGQIFVGDRTGDYAIIENNTITRKSDCEYFVLTNFRVSYPTMTGYPCKRNTTARNILSLKPESSYSNFEFILNAIHQTDPKYSTIYSTICDLKNGEIKVYQFHDFENSVKFNLSDELKKGDHKFYLNDLFPKRSSIILLETAEEKGFDAAYEQMLRLKDSKEYNLCESEITFFADNLIWQYQKAEAFKVYKFALQEYPNSNSLLRKMGEYYLDEGDSQSALSNFKKAYSMNPFDEKAKCLIDQLESPARFGNTKFLLSGYPNANIVTIIMGDELWENYWHIMHKDGDDWVYTIDLTPGPHEYLFVVDGKYVLDPDNTVVKEYKTAKVSVLEKKKSLLL